MLSYTVLFSPPRARNKTDENTFLNPIFMWNASLAGLGRVMAPEGGGSSTSKINFVSFALGVENLKKG